MELSVIIKRKPEDVYTFLSNIYNWPKFSIFASKVTFIKENLWIAHSPDGDYELYTHFNPDTLCLDHSYRPFSSSYQPSIAIYRIISGDIDESILSINVVKPDFICDNKFEKCRSWITHELETIKQYLED